MKKARGLPPGGVTVFVRGGMYFLPQTFKLSAEDSGAPNAPVVYRALEGEKPTLIGGRAITGFALPTYSRMTFGCQPCVCSQFSS